MGWHPFRPDDYQIMLWANTASGKSQAWPGAKGTCPSCGAELVPKCGEITSWHWAHKARDCDSWGEPESEWHLAWKQRFPSDWQERVMGQHRADVLTPRGVIEFQRSGISPEEIRSREAFYGRMVWVVDAREFNLEPAWHWHYKSFSRSKPEPSVNLFSMIDASGNYNRQDPVTLKWLEWSAERREYAMRRQMLNPCFKWLWPRKSWFAASKAIFLDTGDEQLLMIKKVYKGSNTYIACKPITKTTFVDRCTASVKVAA